MKDNKLIASVVVFLELCDNKKDIYDIISEFLKVGIIDKQKWTFSATELNKIINEVFDFKLPEAVIKSTLNNRLLKSGYLSSDRRGQYSVNNLEESINTHLKNNFVKKREHYKKTEDEIVKFIESKRSKKLSDKELPILIDNINQYLLGNVVNEKYTKEISEFIILNRSNKEFAESLNLVREGVVLYTGIRYTADLNELGKWDKPLTIFLDTGMIFNFVGYNGEVFKEIFMDFLNLVREINLSSKRKGKIIHLKYFKETESEIHNFFHVASMIIENKMSLDPSKTAMKEIINGCQTKSDTIVKKNKFFIDLKTSGILLEEDKDYYSNFEYNIEGDEVLKELSVLSKEKNKIFDEEDCKNSLKLFTKINVLRKGSSDNGFENSKFILLTGNSYILYLAHNSKIKVNKKDIPFATDIDFLTDKFWFKLKKGFGKSGDIPKSFDVITKAQIVLSALMNNTVQEKYTELNEKFKKGEITKQEVISLNYRLREESLKPEDITESNIVDSISFMDDFSFEYYLHEKELLNQKVIEGQEAKEELKRRDLVERTKINKLTKRKLKILKGIIIFMFFIFIVLFYFLGYLIIKHFKTENDSPLSIIGFVIGLMMLFPFWKYVKKLNKLVNSKMIISFTRKITSA